MLDSGRHVVTDGSCTSSVAYQGYGRGLPAGEIADLSRWATAGLVPDLVILLEVAPARRGDPARPSARPSRGHRWPVPRPCAGRLRRARSRGPGGWVVLDGDKDVDVLAATIEAVVRERLELS